MSIQQNMDFQARLAKITPTQDVTLEDHLAHAGNDSGRIERDLRKEMLGYPFAVLVGLISGYAGLFLVFVMISPMFGPMSAEQYFAASMTGFFAYALGAMTGPVLACLVMFLTPFQQWSHLVAAGVFAHLTFSTVGLLVDFCQGVIYVTPPQWLNFFAML